MAASPQQRLPFELIDQILTEADDKTLFSARLVSQRVKAAADPLLFATLHPKKYTASFPAAHNVAKHEIYRHYVKALQYESDHSGPLDQCQDACMWILYACEGKRKGLVEEASKEGWTMNRTQWGRFYNDLGRWTSFTCSMRVFDDMEYLISRCPSLTKIVLKDGTMFSVTEVEAWDIIHGWENGSFQLKSRLETSWI